MKYFAQEGEKRKGGCRERERKREERGRKGDRKRGGREGERDYSPVFLSCWNASVAVVVK